MGPHPFPNAVQVSTVRKFPPHFGGTCLAEMGGVSRRVVLSFPAPNRRAFSARSVVPRPGSSAHHRHETRRQFAFAVARTTDLKLHGHVECFERPVRKS